MCQGYLKGPPQWGSHVEQQRPIGAARMKVKSGWKPPVIVNAKLSFRVGTLRAIGGGSKHPIFTTWPYLLDCGHKMSESRERKWRSPEQQSWEQEEVFRWCSSSWFQATEGLASLLSLLSGNALQPSRALFTQATSSWLLCLQNVCWFGRAACNGLGKSPT